MKRNTAMKHCTIAEAVYWYNVAPKDDIDSATATAPANKLYNYEVRLLGIERVQHSDPRTINIPYDGGDAVWVKHEIQAGNCDESGFRTNH